MTPTIDALTGNLRVLTGKCPLFPLCRGKSGADVPRPFDAEAVGVRHRGYIIGCLADKYWGINDHDYRLI